MDEPHSPPPREQAVLGSILDKAPPFPIVDLGCSLSGFQVCQYIIMRTEYKACNTYTPYKAIYRED